jgi:Mn-dependent DtxR family transcriptional regulator
MRDKSASAEDYLLAVFELCGKSDGFVRQTDIAEYMDYSRPSVSYAMSKLQRRGLIQVERERHISLTESGRETAARIYEKRQFFIKLMRWAGMDKKTAEKEAHNLEHAVSDQAFQALRSAFGEIFAPPPNPERIYSYDR